MKKKTARNTQGLTLSFASQSFASSIMATPGTNIDDPNPNKCASLRLLQRKRELRELQELLEAERASFEVKKEGLSRIESALDEKNLGTTYIIPLLATVSKDYCNFFPLGKVFVCLLRLIEAH